MKLLILCASVLFSSYTLACSCSEFPMSHDTAIREYVQGKYDMYTNVTDNDIEWIAYYPTLAERMFWSSVRGTSCEGEGPNGEIMDYCSGSRKSDYRVILQRKECELVLRVKSTVNKVSVKEISSTCRRF